MAGRRFYKMSGSGNDFLVFDARDGALESFTSPTAVRELCARGEGVGADGVVLLEPSPSADFRMIYLNSDGSRASMCGNAALCVTSLAARIGLADADAMRFETDAGLVKARARSGVPELEMDAVTDVREGVPIALERGEERIGFARVGVPHVVVRRARLDDVDVVSRGRQLRHLPSLGPDGANVNFVAPGPEGTWLLRTYERGVEGETLACGTGAVATAILLQTWGESGAETRIRTRSGRDLSVRLSRAGERWQPSLSGEGRLVFVGELPG